MSAEQTMPVTLTHQSYPGRYAVINDDAHLAVKGGPRDLFKAIMLVADGVGRSAKSVNASQEAVQAMLQFIQENLKLLQEQARHPEEPSADQPQDCRPWDQWLIGEALRATNAHVRAHARGAQTTLAGLLFLKNSYIAFSVGDSRAYFLGADGHYSQLTGDTMQTEQAPCTLGKADELPESFYSIGRFKLENQGWYLVCSDGLERKPGSVTLPRICEVLHHTPTIHDGIQQVLRECANVQDNVTVAAAEFGEIPRALSPLPPPGAQRPDPVPAAPWENGNPSANQEPRQRRADLAGPTPAGKFSPQNAPGRSSRRAQWPLVLAFCMIFILLLGSATMGWFIYNRYTRSNSPGKQGEIGQQADVQGDGEEGPAKDMASNPDGKLSPREAPTPRPRQGDSSRMPAPIKRGAPPEEAGGPPLEATNPQRPAQPSSSPDLFQTPQMDRQGTTPAEPTGAGLKGEQGPAPIVAETPMNHPASDPAPSKPAVSQSVSQVPDSNLDKEPGPAKPVTVSAKPFSRREEPKPKATLENTSAGKKRGSGKAPNFPGPQGTPESNPRIAAAALGESRSAMPPLRPALPPRIENAGGGEHSAAPPATASQSTTATASHPAAVPAPVPVAKPPEPTPAAGGMPTSVPLPSGPRAPKSQDKVAEIRLSDLLSNGQKIIRNCEQAAHRKPVQIKSGGLLSNKIRLAFDPIVKSSECLVVFEFKFRTGKQGAEVTAYTTPISVHEKRKELARGSLDFESRQLKEQLQMFCANKDIPVRVDGLGEMTIKAVIQNRHEQTIETYLGTRSKIKLN